MAKLNNNKNNKVDFLLRGDFSLIDASLELYKSKDSEEELKKVKDLLEKEPRLVEILTDPDIKEEEKKTLIDNIFKGRVSNQMLVLLNKIFLRYTQIVSVTAVTAVPMESKAQERLKATLSRKLDKDVILYNEVDKKIIGGILLKVGDRLMDATLLSELKTIRNNLREASI